MGAECSKCGHDLVWEYPCEWCALKARAEAAEAERDEIEEQWQRSEDGLREVNGRLRAEKEAAEARERPLRSFAQWIVALDAPDSTERRTITMTKIIDAAEAALAANPSREGGEGGD